MNYLLSKRGRVRPDLTALQGQGPRIPAAIHEEPSEEGNRLGIEGQFRGNVNINQRPASLGKTQADHTYSQSEPSIPVTRPIANPPRPHAHSVDLGPFNLPDRAEDRQHEDFQRQFKASGRSLSTPNYVNYSNAMAMRPERPIRQKTLGEASTQHSGFENTNPSQDQYGSMGNGYPPVAGSQTVNNADGSHSLRRPDGSLEPLTGAWRSLSNDRQERIAQDRYRLSIQRKPIGSRNRSQQDTMAAESLDDPPMNSSYSPPNSRQSDPGVVGNWEQNPSPFTNPVYGDSSDNTYTSARHDPYASDGRGLPSIETAGDSYTYAMVNGRHSLSIGREEGSPPVMGNDGRYSAGPSPNTSTASRKNSAGSSNSRYSAQSAPAQYSYGGQYEDDADPMDFPPNFEDSDRGDQGYDSEVLVWQGNEATYATMLFDTQCRASNWVSLKIVRKLRPQLNKLPRPAEFEAFNGQPLIATWETTLSFMKDGGAERSARFLVAPNEDVRFDILLGASDLRRFRIIDPPMLSLMARRQNKAEEEETKSNVGIHIDEAKEHERRRKKYKEKKAAMEATYRGQKETSGDYNRRK